METPSQTLASKIVQRLAEERLLLPEAAQKLVSPLASGKLRAEDWRLPIEVATSKSDDSAEGQP